MTVSPLENGRPLAIDLFCGLGGWTEGLLAEGFDVIGFDIERHVYGDQQYPAQLVLQDVCTIHGSQFKDASLIVASSPCQAYSYMAMPWSRAKQIANALRGNGAFPENYTGSRTIAELNTLFDQPARIQREASEAAGRWIPMIQENVKGAQPWVGNAQWSFGSFYLWGDIPALMPNTLAGRKNSGGSWFNVGSPGQKVVNRITVHDGIKNGSRLFPNDCADRRGVHRKAASAQIAKIPFPLASYIARVYHPDNSRAVA